MQAIYKGLRHDNVTQLVTPLFHMVGIGYIIGDPENLRKNANLLRFNLIFFSKYN